MAIKIVISKPGFNVLTETNPNNLIFSSDYDTLKYHVSGSADVRLNSNAFPGTVRAEVQVTHDLGYSPFFIVFVNKFAGGSANNYHLCPGQVLHASWNPNPPPTFLEIDTQASAYADTTRLYLQVMRFQNYSQAYDNTFNFRYFIFRNNTGI
jgi:hypothetical protein